MITRSEMTTTPTLGEFILAEIDKRGISAREFAKLVGVNHKIINKYIDYGTKDVGGVSPRFIHKLAKATSFNPLLLYALAYPELQEAITKLVHFGVSGSIREQRVEQLPESDVSFIDSIIEDRLRLQSKNDEDV